MSFDLTADELRQERRARMDADARDKQKCVPYWLDYIKQQVKSRPPWHSTPESIILIANMERDLPADIPAAARTVTDEDFTQLKAAIEANNSGFTVVKSRTHLFQCDCDKTEGCSPCIIVQWSWE